MEPLRLRYGRSELLRVEDGLAIYPGEREVFTRYPSEAESSLFSRTAEPDLLRQRAFAVAR